MELRIVVRPARLGQTGSAASETPPWAVFPGLNRSNVRSAKLTEHVARLPPDAVTVPEPIDQIGPTKSSPDLVPTVAVKLPMLTVATLLSTNSPVKPYDLPREIFQ